MEIDSTQMCNFSQFSDIYQEDHFIKYLTPDIRIVKELPEEFESLDLEAIGSVVSYCPSIKLTTFTVVCFCIIGIVFFQVSDIDMVKEAKPSFYLKHILPILLKNQVVHFVGFGNRLAFDPISFELQVTCFDVVIAIGFLIYYLKPYF